MELRVRDMSRFREDWIKNSILGKRLSEKDYDEVSKNIREFFHIVHGDKSNIGSFLNKEINLTGDYQIIYELMQNAEDADADKLLVYYNDKYLLFVNNGEPFSDRNIKSICNVGQSTKSSNNENSSIKHRKYIGKFGIGFKLVYHLLGGVEQIMKYKAPIIFSWGDKKEIEDFLNCDSFESADVEHPVLFKPILTSVPVGINEKVYDLDGNERILFEEKEIIELKKFIEEMNINDTLKNFERGSLFFLELINKDNFKENLKKQINEIENSLIFLSSLRKVIINGISFKKPEENIKHIILKENKENNEKEIVFAYSPFNDILKDRPNFYCYFPIADEKHGLNFIINSSKFEIETSRRKLKGSGKDNININILKESVKLIKNKLEEIKEITKRTKNIKEFEELFYAILSSDEPKDENVKKFVYDELMSYISENIPCKDKNGDILFENKDKVIIKNTELNIHPKDFGINKYWLYVDNKKLEKLIRSKKFKNKKFLKNYSIVSLLKDSEADFEKINEWIKNLDYSMYLKFLNELIENWSENDEFLDKIRKLKFILTESENFVCLDEGVYFPVKDSENLKIERFNFINKRLLKDDKIKKFFEEKLKIKELNEKIIILEGILLKYENEAPDVSYEENIEDLRYIKENLNKLKGSEKKEVLDKIKESYIIQVRDKDENIKFSKPINAYIPKKYSGDDSLEVYFTGYPADFVIENYLDNEKERKEWFKFLKEIECNDKPILKYKIWVCEKRGCCYDYNYIIKMETEKNQFSEVIYISSEWGIIPLIESRLKRRLYGDEYSNHCYILCDWEIEGLENALNNIKNGQNAFEISKSIWKFLKDITLENEKLKGMYHWFYRGHKTKSFDSYIYTLLKESEWLYDENRVFKKPTELFYPTNENKKLLGDNVNYLHSDFVDEYSKSIAEIVGIKINANIYDILDYLKGLSGNDVEFNKILKIYKFIYSEIIKNNIEKVKDYFSKYPLIYIPKSKKWRKIDEVFWEDESIVFEDLKDYLVKYYKDEEMKLFFEKIGVKVKANISDYINAIIDISENVEAINDKIKKRIQRLYKKIWDDLKLDENLWIEYESELNKLKNGRYWLANKNGEYKFYYINEIVINDHKYYYELFKDKIPFWEFNKEFTKEFGAESLSESIKISIKYGNKEKELSVWTNKLNEIMPEIIKFILSKNEEDEELEDILKKLPKIKIWKTDKIFAEYEIKNKTANDEIESYLDLENRTLYVSSVEDIPDLIGDAFEEYFMKYKINNLREFIKDLMITKNKEKILKKWCKRGINFDIDVKKYFEITDYEDTNEENAINNNIDTNLNEINKEDESKNIEKIEESNKIDNGKIKEYDKTNEIKTDDKKDNDITEIKDLGDNKNNHEGIKPDIGGFNKIYKEYDNYDKLISKRNEKIKKTESLKDKKRLKNKISDKKQKREENYIKDDTNSVECLKSNYECRKITKIQKPIKYYKNERNDYINKLIEKLNETLEEFYSSEPYSVDWFKKLIEIELMMSKRKFVSNTLKITFYKVKKISNYLLELSLSNKPVPQFIEDFPNIRIYDENNNLIEFSAISVDKNKVRIKVKSITREPKKITIEIGDLSYLLETLKEIYDSLSYNIKEEILNKLNKIKIIYGPPGTGKTTKIVEDILKIEDLKNKKILFLAPTNKAVDVFVQKIRDVSEGKIEHLKQYQNKAEELINNKLVVRYKSTSNEKIEDLASENINNASIVATTIVKISYDETLQNYNPDILIIDECSMIPLPYIICAILHYDNDNLESIWISGDPNQIQPVGMSEYWREYNIYKMFNDLLEIDMHNITEDYETHFRGGYVRLTKQYRSITPIGELFSRYTYNGILKHYRESEKPDYLSNMTNSNICVVKCDIKEGERLKDVYKIENSPINIYSAILATELALKIKEILKNQRLKKSIGIISPYKFQSHLIEGLISNQIEDDDIEIYASTVHKFQGEECDIIIVVLNPPNTNNINNNSLLNNKNLLNVAISRARDYLFILLPNVNNISENLIRLYGYIKQLDGGVKIIGSEELEKSLLNGKIIKNISFISTHGKINTYGKDIGVKYEIKLDEINNKNLNSIDVFINK